MAPAEHHENAFARVQMADDQFVKMRVSRAGNGESDAVGSELSVRQRASLLSHEAGSQGLAIETLVPARPLRVVGEHVWRQVQRGSIRGERILHKWLQLRIARVRNFSLTNPLRNVPEHV